MLGYSQKVIAVDFSRKEHVYLEVVKKEKKVRARLLVLQKSHKMRKKLEPPVGGLPRQHFERVENQPHTSKPGGAMFKKRRKLQKHPRFGSWTRRNFLSTTKPSFGEIHMDLWIHGCITVLPFHFDSVCRHLIKWHRHPPKCFRVRLFSITSLVNHPLNHIPRVKTMDSKQP